MTSPNSQTPAHRRLFTVIATALLPVTLIAAPASATSNPLMSPPTLTIDSAGVLSITSGAWSNPNVAVQRQVIACRSAVSKQETLDTMANLAEVFRVSVCLDLSQASSAANFPTNLNTAFMSSGPSSWAPFEASSGRNFIVYIEFDTSNQTATWTESVQFGTSYAGSPAGPSQFSQAQMDPGVSYVGPTISGISKRIMSSDGAEGMVLTGSRLNLITTVAVDGMPGITDFTLIDGFPLTDFKKQRGIRFVEPIPAGTYEVVVTTKGHGTIRFKVTFS